MALPSRIELRVDPVLRGQLDAVSSRLGLTASATIRRLIEEASSGVQSVPTVAGSSDTSKALHGAQVASEAPQRRTLSTDDILAGASPDQP